MNPVVKKEIKESIDTALSSFDYVDKSVFYDTLKAQYGLKQEDIPENYDLFHEALSEIYGLKHYSIERKIISVLHTRSKGGSYAEANEIPAFVIIVESYFKETKELLAKSKQTVEKNKAKLDEFRAQAK